MDEIAVSVQNVSKVYPLYRRPADRLKEMLTRWRRSYHTDFWALRDISFDVPKGQTLGIIGQNGAGKSTLLQIIAGVLQPTTGTVTVNGRVTALLELGTGFNPEFTGRENVYMSGAILGISQQEMREKFDDIAAFAQIGQFIDQPVKIYSTGMYVRLAFAIATNVEPDILIVDEALAVGDVYFQQRCMRRMREFKESGKAIIFVTHDAAAVKNLCDRAMWLEKGQMQDMGEPEHVVSRYLAAMFGQPERQVGLTTAPPVEVKSEDQREVAPSQEALPPETVIPNIDRRFGDGRAEIIGVDVYNGQEEKTRSIVHGQAMKVRVSVYCHEDILHPLIGFVFRDRLGRDIASTNTALEGNALPPARAGDILTVSFVCELPLLYPDNYSISPTMAEGLTTEDCRVCDWVDNALVIKLIEEEKVFASMRFKVACRPESQISNSVLGKGFENV